MEKEHAFALKEKQMKKKILTTMAIIAALAVTTAVTIAMSPKKDLKPSDYAIGVTYEQAMADKKPFIELFYANWCSYCMRFMPKYKSIADIYKNKYNFVMINVDDEQYKKVVDEAGVSGFPTLYIVDPTIDNKISLNNSIYDDLKKLRVELDRYLRIRAMIKQ